jgi:hypothetical protein
MIEFICNENEKSTDHFVDIRPEAQKQQAQPAPQK